MNPYAAQDAIAADAEAADEAFILFCDSESLAEDDPRSYDLYLIALDEAADGI